jgi:hypothetical protein
LRVSGLSLSGLLLLYQFEREGEHDPLFSRRQCNVTAPDVGVGRREEKKGNKKPVLKKKRKQDII